MQTVSEDVISLESICSIFENLVDLTPRSTCGRREEPDSCANPCQPTCREPNRSPCPTFTCSAGCVCKRGFRRADDTANSSCVKCS